MQWKGPYSIIQQIGQMDYKIDMGVKMKQLLQILRKTLNENLKTVSCVLSLIYLSDPDADEEQD